MPDDTPAPSQRRKRPIPLHVRREVAARYGCKPFQSVGAICSYCGRPGSINWANRSWVALSGLEFDHIIPESLGGAGTADNLTLACRPCNRSKGARIWDPMF